MNIVYSMDDRIPVKIDEVAFKVSPLSYKQKNEIQNLMDKCISTQEMSYARDAAILAVKYAVKSVDGLKKSNGDSYEVKLEDGMVSDQCVDELLNLALSTKLATVCTSLVNGITGKVFDERGNELEGVSFEVSEEKK